MPQRFQKLFAWLMVVVTVCAAGCAETLSVRNFDLMPGAPASVPLVLHKPTRVLASRPAVIYISGCRQPMNNNRRAIVNALTDRGILVAELVQPYWPQTACQPPTGFQRAAAAFDARRQLVAKGLADERNVGLVGFSHGGWTIMHAMLMQTSNGDDAEAPPFAAVAFYPYCNAVDFRSFELRTPTLLLAGGQDTWTPAIACESLVEKIRNEQRGTQAIEYVHYPDATHGWDDNAAQLIFVDFRAAWTSIVPNPAVTRDAIQRTIAFFEQHLVLR
jgi:dienelactone hydrolase